MNLLSAKVKNGYVKETTAYSEKFLLISMHE